MFLWLQIYEPFCIHQVFFVNSNSWYWGSKDLKSLSRVVVVVSASANVSFDPSSAGEHLRVERHLRVELCMMAGPLGSSKVHGCISFLLLFVKCWKTIDDDCFFVLMRIHESWWCLIYLFYFLFQVFWCCFGHFKVECSM